MNQKNRSIIKRLKKDQVGKASLVLIKDTTLPSLSITNPVANTIYLNNASDKNITFSGGCSEDGKTVSVTSTASHSVSVICSATSGWQANLNFTSSPNASITVTAHHQDAAGNPAGPATRTVIKDSIQPAISISSTALNVNIANQSSYPISGGCSENGLNVVLTATGIGLPTEALCEGGGYDTAMNFSLTPDGAITLTANFTNTVGVAAPTETLTGIKDTQAPALAITNPAPNSYINAATAGGFVVAGSCSDNGSSIMFGAAGSGSTTCSSGSFTMSFDLTGKSQGPLVISADTQDGAGNPAGQATRSFNYDTVSPSFTLANPVSNFVINNSNVGGVTFSGTCSDEGRNIQLAIPNFSLQTIGCGTGGVFSAPLTFSGKPNGSITFTASYSDLAGNPAPNVTRVISKLTNNALTLTIDALTQGYVNSLNKSNFPVSGTCSENNRTVSLGGTRTASATCAGSEAPYTWSALMNFDTANQGVLTITAAMTDSGGNPAPTPNPVTVTKDSIAPTSPTGFVYPSIFGSSNQSPELTWVASNDLGGTPITRYEIAIGSNTGLLDLLDWNDVGNVLHAHGGGLSLVNNGNYYPSVRAVDLAGNPSDPAQGTPWSAQLTPTPTPTPTNTPTPSPTPITCPAGYIAAGPLAPYTTNQFCVAQYEAKHSWSISFTEYAGSVAAGTPWGNISRDQARTACSANVTYSGMTYSLITNAEWQTVARTIESQASNWSDGSVGSGAINQGNTDTSPGLAPSTDENCLYYSVGCSATGTFAFKRTHNLPNGTIWDLSGNAWELIYDDNSTSFGAVNGYVSQLTGDSNPIIGTLGGVTGKAKDLFGPLGDYTSLISGAYGGLGGYDINYSGMPILRGGGWGDVNASAGVFYTFLGANWTNINFGFRCSIH